MRFKKFLTVVLFLLAIMGINASVSATDFTGTVNLGITTRMHMQSLQTCSQMISITMLF